MSEPAAILDSLNATERSVLESILKSGDLSILESLYDEDYEEIPVTIDEFISNPRYLGSVYDGGDLVYPYWRNFLHKFFHDNTDKAFEVCLAGDTVIPLLDGTKPTIKELAESENKERYLYSYDMNSNEYTVGKTSDIWSTGIKPVYRITLDNGESLKLTSNHRLLTRDKHWKSIDSGLSVGDSLMPFSTIIDEYGYERVLAREYNHKIVSIEYVGEEEVFDISVEGTHNFAIGAGIVAHNCLTGAIGVGKTTIAAIMMTYIIYKTLCLKDPRKFYRLTGNSPIVFVVMNLTLDLAYQGLYTLIVENIKSSPWFLERVDIRGKYDVIIEFKEGIQLIAGSNTNHVIGKNVIAACVTGDTEILTTSGYKPIESLKDELVRVATYQDGRLVFVEEPVLIQETKRVTELYEIELEDGTVLRCTPDHRFLLKDGTYKYAKDLTLEDEFEEVSKCTE